MSRADDLGEITAPDTCALITRSSEIAFGRYTLNVIHGPDKGTCLAPTTPEITIGTAKVSDLKLRDRTVSRLHFSITATPRGFCLRDLGSTNGTTLGGYRVDAGYLRTGAIIGAGETRLRFEALSGEVREPIADRDRYGRVLGESGAMRRIFSILPKIADSDATVLIEGETGTGKGLLADVLHQGSRRARGPFIVLDCSAIPPTLVEAELFGYAKGAFTGAHAARAGAFEAANGGTIFLDEIGELTLDMQPKLLRALEERSIRRVGSFEPVSLDVRVIAATNRDLRIEVNRGRFRSDLFYRLNVVRLRVPPLRERPEDIALLATHFYQRLVRDDGASPPPELIRDLSLQSWPGNVRELRGAVERAVLMGDAALWREDAASNEAAPESDEPAIAIDLSRPFRETKEHAIARWERAYLRALVRLGEGNISRASRAARMDRNHLRDLLRRHGISASEDAP